MEIINNIPCQKHDQNNQLWLHHGHTIAKLTLHCKTFNVSYLICAVFAARSQQIINLSGLTHAMYKSRIEQCGKHLHLATK